MIILPNEKNLIDQNFIEYFLLVDHGIPMLRISLSDINSKAKLEDNFLFINDYEISVAYFRSGYNPEHYPTELEWNARRIIEKSQAISCPSVAYQLSGTKKVQQMLSSRETLSKFIKDESKKEALMEIFMTMYPANESAVKEALCNPSKFVMKPQREGGGNNFYDENLVKILKNATEEQKKEYILMEKINSKPRAGHVVRNGQLSSSRLVSELGIFGSIFVNEKGDVLYNKAFGHLLRSKCYSENDGGIAAGVAIRVQNPTSSGIPREHEDTLCYARCQSESNDKGKRLNGRVNSHTNMKAPMVQVRRAYIYAIACVPIPYGYPWVEKSCCLGGTSTLASHQTTGFTESLSEDRLNLHQYGPKSVTKASRTDANSSPVLRPSEVIEEQYKSLDVVKLNGKPKCPDEEPMEYIELTKP
ncbi:glutathione synthetase-like [Zophobas morio]|uniref:glutathione synthetase-like n=1 Tax=Zophobas morio TaxID=2755281 RepID=UPI0030831737